MSVTWSWKENYAKLKLNKSGFLHPTAQHENSGLWQYSCNSVLSMQHYTRKKRQQLALSPAWGLTDHLMSSLSPHHLQTVPTRNPSTGEANARIRLSLRPGWATDSKTLSKGEIKTLVIMISEHFLFVNCMSYFNMSQKLRKESNFTSVLSWDNWPINNQESMKQREEPLSRLPV